MKFWSGGRQYDTDTMSAAEKIRLLAEVEMDLGEVHAAIAEFNTYPDLKEFSRHHFGRDGVAELYTDRSEVSRRLEQKLNDLLTSDRVAALAVLGVEPIGSN